MKTKYTIDNQTLDALKYLTRRINRIELDVRGLSRQSGVAFSSIEAGDGALLIYDDEGNVIGSVGGDGIGLTATAIGPPQPESPDVEGGVNTIIITYDGTFVDGDWEENLVDHVEIHATANSGDPLDDTTQIGTFVSSNGGVFTYPWNAVDGGRWIYLVAVTTAGEEGSPSDGVLGVPLAFGTDGVPPATAPVISARGGIQSVIASWDAVDNPDPTLYRVYVTNGSTPSTVGTTDLFITTPSTSVVVNRLPDGTPIGQAMVIHVLVIPQDDDGDGPVSNEDSAQPIQIQTIDIASAAINATKLGFGDLINWVVNAGFENGSTVPHALGAIGTALAIDATANSGTFGALITCDTRASGSPGIIFTANGPQPTDAESVQEHMPVRFGDMVRGEFWARTGTVAGTPGCRVMVEVFDGDGTSLGQHGGTLVALSGVYQLVFLDYQVAEPTAAFATLNGQIEGTTAGDTIRIDDLRLSNKITGTNIADGAINTSQLAANSVVAANIVANTITAAQIAAGTISTTELAANTITAANIAANSITAAELAANTITGAKIAAGTITASNIAVGTITGDRLAANTITTTKLSATAIDGMTITAPTIQTAGGLGSGGQGMQLSADLAGGVIKFWTGLAAETGPGWINPNDDALGNPALEIASPSIASFGRTTMLLTATYLDISGGPLTLTGAQSNIMADKAIHSFSNGLFMDDLAGGGTTGASIGNGGRVQRTTSTRRYKHNIKPMTIETAHLALALESVTFKRKKQENQPADKRTYSGFIAEQAHEAGANLWVQYDKEDVPEGFAYAELTAAHNMLIKELYGKIEHLEERIASMA